MPINPVSAPTYYLIKPADADITSAIWTYVPGEELDFSRFSKICTLYLGAYKPRNSEDINPYTIPSLAGLFPNLTQIFIKHWDLSEPCFIGCLTDIPESVIQVTLDNTYITDLTPILSIGTNIRSLIVKYNVLPIAMSHPLPEKLQVFTLIRTFVTSDLILPKNIEHIMVDSSNIQRILGLECIEDLEMVTLYLCESITPYSLTQYTKYVMGMDNSNYITKIHHILRVNAQQIYSDLGSLPKRIIVPENAHMDDMNPIILAMNLASNYPRRMAEFVAYIPTKLTNSNPEKDDELFNELENIVNYPDFEENNYDDVEDGDDHYNGDY